MTRKESLLRHIQDNFPNNDWKFENGYLTLNNTKKYDHPLEGSLWNSVSRYSWSITADCALGRWILQNIVIV